MGDFNQLLSCLYYQKIVDPVGKHEPKDLTYNLTIKEFHILVLIGSGYKTLTDIYQALKYLRLFLSFSSVFVYVDRLEDKGFINITGGHGPNSRALFATCTLQGFTVLQQIQKEILDKPKNKLRPPGAQGKPWKQKALKHIRFNGNGHEINEKGQIKGLEYNETRGRKKQSKPPASESE